MPIIPSKIDFDVEEAVLVIAKLIVIHVATRIVSVHAIGLGIPDVLTCDLLIVRKLIILSTIDLVSFTPSCMITILAISLASLIIFSAHN